MTFWSIIGYRLQENETNKISTKVWQAHPRIRLDGKTYSFNKTVLAVTILPLSTFFLQSMLSREMESLYQVPFTVATFTYCFF